MARSSSSVTVLWLYADQSRSASVSAPSMPASTMRRVTVSRLGTRAFPPRSPRPREAEGGDVDPDGLRCAAPVRGRDAVLERRVEHDVCAGDQGRQLVGGGDDLAMAPPPLAQVIEVAGLDHGDGRTELR